MTLDTAAETEMARIARGLRERDMELLADLVERCQHRLVRYLLYLIGRREQAEDLAQETWVRVLQRGSQYDGRQLAWSSLAHGFTMTIMSAQAVAHGMHRRDSPQDIVIFVAIGISLLALLPAKQASSDGAPISVPRFAER